VSKDRKHTPAVSPRVLIFVAGMVWVSVGAVLLWRAVAWLAGETRLACGLLLGAGVVLALLMHHLVLLRIVDRNLSRLHAAGEKRCFFSFFPWKSYLLIPVMIAAGFLLRRTGLPRPCLAVLYAGMGLALILSSVRYVRVFLRERPRR